MTMTLEGSSVPNAHVTKLPVIMSPIYGTLMSVSVGPSYENIRERSIRMSVRNNDGVYLPVRMAYDADVFAKLEALKDTWVYVNLESVTIQDYLGYDRPKEGQIEDQRIAFNARAVEAAL